jgi:plasmid stabilization system protein ParE
MRVRITGEATADVQAIRVYIALDSPRAAAAMVQSIRAGFRRLAAHPEAGGRYADPVGGELRLIVVRRYLIIYRITSGEVVVHRVLGPGQTLSGGS